VVDRRQDPFGCLEMLDDVVDHEQGRDGLRANLLEARDRHHFLSAFETAAVIAGV
jgi:hypothetical protein